MKMNKIISYIHPEGWRFGVIFLIATFFLYFISSILGLIGIVLTLWCLYFFRDPIRCTPVDDNLVISPADGKVCLIKEVQPPKELELGDLPLYRVSIFLNVFDVHINRAPVKGKIERIIYYPGKFINASLDKASEFNERNAIVIKTDKDQQIGVVQIAGLIARRIVSFVSQNDPIKAGERFGLIRFGSRVDVYLPHGIKPRVIVGQRAIAGETILASLDGEQMVFVGECQ